MSCWVVPTIAAEFWNVSLDHVLSGIKQGAIPTRKENGFTFIDVLPDAHPNTASAKEPHPPTYRPAAYPLPPLPPLTLTSNPSRPQPDPFTDYKQVRPQTSTLRRPPLPQAA